jgi:DNA-binding MarR family transcriptional regulator
VFGFRTMNAATPLSAPAAREERLVEAMMGLTRATMRVLRQEAMVTGLSMPQGHLLSWLAREGGQPTTAWAQHIGTSASTISELADGLERMGLIRRARRSTDRRQVLLEITAAGRRLSERIRAGQREQLGVLLEGLPTAELERTIQVVETLTERINAAEVAEPKFQVKAGGRSTAAHRPAPRTRRGPGERARPHSIPMRRADA